MNLRDSIGVTLIAGFIAALGLLFWKAIPSSNEQLIVYMLGQLSGFVGGVVAYHYTLSKQSEKATENTGAAFRAIEAAANATPPSASVADAVHAVADAAQTKADDFSGDSK